ncbi:MAG: CDP-alcohol phosphatidyltransferase family protein [Hyphomicrobiales bacterium]
MTAPETGSSDGLSHPKGKAAHRYRAFAVHVFTASGATIAFLALTAAIEQKMGLAFAWLGLALLVDGIDGTFARAWAVQKYAPQLSGDVLDLVVDYVTYVFVPAVILFMSGLYPHLLFALQRAIIVLSAALYFASNTMKTNDYWFRGFPAVWNLVVFLILVFQPPASATTIAVILLALAQASNFTFVHPVRVKMLRPLTLTLLGVWVVAAVIAIIEDMKVDAITQWVLGFIAVYFLALGLLRRETP